MKNTGFGRGREFENSSHFIRPGIENTGDWRYRASHVGLFDPRAWCEQKAAATFVILAAETIASLLRSPNRCAT